MISIHKGYSSSLQPASGAGADQPIDGDWQLRIIDPVTRDMSNAPRVGSEGTAIGSGGEYGWRVPVLFGLPLLLLCYTAWRFVARRAREQGGLRGRQVAAINGFGVALVLLFGFGLLASGGLPRRFPPDALQAAQYLGYDRAQSYREGTCFLGSGDAFSRFDRRTCLQPVSGRPNILIFGDSQAAQLWYGLDRTFPEVHFLQATASACTQMLDQPPDTAANCRQLSEFMHREFLGHTHVDAVILSCRWRPDQIADLDRQIAWMKQRGIAVILVGPGLEYDLPLPRILGMSLREKTSISFDTHWDAEAKTADDKLRQLASDTWKVPYISMFDDLCTPRCAVYGAPGVPIFFDGHHFTAEGSLLFAQVVRARNQLPAVQAP